MLMSVVEEVRSFSSFPEITNSRVLITGLSCSAGVDVARSFAESRARLIIQAPETSPQIAALFAVLTQSASEIKLYTDPFDSNDDARRFAQTAVKAYGGLDMAINIVDIAPHELPASSGMTEIEDFVADKLGPLSQIIRVVANRMRLTFTEGTILNIVSMPAPSSAREAALASVLRATLAAMTRTEAKTWAAEGIRINAIGPRSALPGESLSGTCLNGEADIAAVALYLASAQGKQLSGQIFDAEGASCCS
jgi:NAD(P)-dependent dehydrogenase (short-subunit alcohol dehydrogenase family)